MKGDFSRIRFVPARHYTAVLQQQGRVALDADANEQAAIDAYLRDTELTDVVGAYGGPAGDAGFDITFEDGGIRIGAGRYYVQGILCENDRALDYDGQPYLIGPSQTAAELLQGLRDGALGALRVYLEVWQRLVTALDDGCLREPALGQADTTARLQTVWRVVADGVAADGSAAPAPAPAGFRTAVSAGSGRVAPAAGAGRLMPGAALRRPVPHPPVPPRRPLPEDCCAEMYRPRFEPAPGKLSAQTGGGAADCSCEPTPAAGYRGLENQLYRVEIQRGGDAAAATFKWSRENGSVVSAVTAVSGANVTVDSLGPDAYLGYAPGQWVELSDDSNLFGLSPNQPGELFQIQSVIPEQLTIVLTQPAVPVDPAKNARVRRWDQFGASAAAAGVPLSAGNWLDLENGIQVQFTAGQYAPGDHWVIPARTASGEIDWPPCEGDGAAFQPPHGTRVYRAPLACLRWSPADKQVTKQDCRRLFSPLTSLTPPAPPAAIHVTGINWPNDDVWTLDQLIANGLVVTLDGGPTSKIDAAAFAVSLEVPAPVKGALGEAGATVLSGGGAPSTLLRTVTVVDGPTNVQGQTLTWAMPFTPDVPAQDLAVLEIQNALLPGAAAGVFARARVRLLGRMIYAGGAAQAFLDGQAYGAAGVRSDGVTPRIDLRFPSGNGEKASDFESWFYLAPVLTVASVSLQPPEVHLGPVRRVVRRRTTAGAAAEAFGEATSQGTVALGYPALADTAVSLSVSGGGTATVTVPPAVTVPAHQTSAPFTVTVRGALGAATQTYQIVASLTTAIGRVVTQSATLTVTGAA